MVVVQVNRAARENRRSLTEDSFSIEHLNVCIKIHIRDHIVNILEVSAVDFRSEAARFVQNGRYELKQVGEYNVLPILDLEILCYVMTNNFDLAVWSLF